MLKQLKLEKEGETNNLLIDETVVFQETSIPVREKVSKHTPLVGKCLDSKHPTLSGRVLVTWKDLEGKVSRKWIPSLYGMTIREGDRVLLLFPKNWPEPIVVGVVDGFALRPPKEKLEKASLDLERDESITVYAANGEKILEVFYEESGPVVKLMKEDIEVEMPGKLRLSAKSVNIEAKTGDVKIKASDDVKIEGEVIKLN